MHQMPLSPCLRIGVADWQCSQRLSLTWKPLTNTTRMPRSSSFPGIHTPRERGAEPSPRSSTPGRCLRQAGSSGLHTLLLATSRTLRKVEAMRGTGRSYRRSPGGGLGARCGKFAFSSTAHQLMLTMSMSVSSALASKLLAAPPSS